MGTARTRTGRAALALAGTVLLLTAGCGGDTTPETPAAAATPVERTAQRGPVTLVVRADRDAITVGEKLNVTIDVTAPPGVDVTMPEPPDPLGPFAVRNVVAPPDVPEGEERRWTHVWTLDTFAVGETEIPEITIAFRDRRPGVEGGAGEDGSSVSAGPLPVTVASVLRGDETPTDIHDIKGEAAVDVPVPPIVWWLAGGGALLLVAIVAIVILVLKRRAARPAPPVPVVPAHIWAFDELDRLEAAGLVERGAFHAFYFRLSDIVRQYIERRFGLMAPERTTEEFLRDAGRSAVLSADDREQLGGFLGAADMVKFALHEPSSAESRDALAAARDFVERTRRRETTNGSPGSRAVRHDAGAAA